MKIIIIADYGFADGGAPKVALESAAGLAGQGHDVVFVAAVREAPGMAPVRHPGVTHVNLGLEDVWSLPLPRAAVSGIWNREAGRRLLAALRVHAGPDTVVHLHQWTKCLSPAAFAAIFQVRLPLVVTCHDYFISCPTGLFYRFDTQHACSLVPLSVACLAAPCDPRSSAHKAIRVLRSFATRRAISQGKLAFVHVSDRGRTTVERFLPSNARHVRIDNPVAIARGACADMGQGARKAFYLGRITVEKGALVAACAAREAGVPIVFVGDGPAATEVRRLNRQAEMRPWIEAAAVGDLLRREALMLVAPSRWPETGPLTVFEAMAVGVPVVGSLLSGAAEKLVDGRSGFVVAPEVAACAAAMLRLAGGDAAARIGAQAFGDYWTDPLTLERHVKALSGVYGDMLAGNLPVTGD